VNKASKGLIPSFVGATGGSRPTGALARALLLGGAGWLGGKAIGGWRDLHSEDPYSTHGDRASKVLGLTGLATGLLAGVPGLVRNVDTGRRAGDVLKYLNMPAEDYKDPQKMHELMWKTIAQDPATYADVNKKLVSGGRDLKRELQGLPDMERDVALELAGMQLGRNARALKGMWTPKSMTAMDYAPLTEEQWGTVSPYVDRLTDYAETFNKQPYGVRQYVRSNFDRDENGMMKSNASVIAGSGFENLLNFEATPDFAPGTRYGHQFPALYTENQINQDPHLGPTQKAQAIMLVRNASNSRPGLITWNDVARAGVGMGLGYGTSKLFGKVLDGVFGGLAPKTHKRLVQAGTVAGLLLNTGAISR
jgi:hypothetical protein